MKYNGMPSMMWALFVSSFEKALANVLQIRDEETKRIANKAKAEYQKIIEDLPEFEKGDRFRMNIVSCAMFAAFCRQFCPLPDAEDLTEFYKQGMMNGKMKLFCKISGLKKFSKRDQQGMMETAKFRAADRNPYSWNMEYLPYADGSGYEARFTKCGICTLMKQLGLEKAIPAMCRLDYTMAEAGGVCDFIRDHTLASGGPYCDCGYKKKR
ncbi:MAG: L-2-amino-thiazoline-4-carboxylic acid hydrolase [Erysipelotrichaceae bacterium]|nr:L-2-amino-thiazoline-4-carboxylic acid hydrolase [Erysipelotrichaceae bacterium]